MKNLLLSSFVFLFFGCAASSFNNLVLLENRNLESNEIAMLTSNKFASSKFLTSVDAYGYHLSGLLIVKPMDKNHYRIGFINQTGINIFSFEISKDSFHIDYCLEQLNKKSAIGLVEADLRLLLFNNIPPEKVNIYLDTMQTQRVYKFEDGLKSNYYFVDGKSNELVKIESEYDGERTLSCIFSEFEDYFPASINIKHYDYPLEIALQVLKEE